MLDMEFDPLLFEIMMKHYAWFAPNPPPPISKETFAEKENHTTVEICQYLLALTFGAYGFEKDPDYAEGLALELLAFLEGERQEAETRMDEENRRVWLYVFASVSVILGTVYGLQEEYVKATYHFMRALKTRTIGLSFNYASFIAYCADKLKDMPAKELSLTGRGYSKDMPMGSTVKQGGYLDASAAPFVFSHLEGVEDGVIAYFRGSRLEYGLLERRGSTRGKETEHMIDIYETLVIDKTYRLYKVRFYFNGYLSREEKPEICVPEGYRVLPYSHFNQFFALT